MTDWSEEPEGGYTAYPANYPVPPAFCKKDWQMHSCALLRLHDGDHVCPCGERRPNENQGL